MALSLTQRNEATRSEATDVTTVLVTESLLATSDMSLTKKDLVGVIAPVGSILKEVSVVVVSESLKKVALNITLIKDGVFSITVVVGLSLVATPRVTSREDLAAC